MINIRLNWPTPNTPSIIINIIISLADRLIEFVFAGGSLIDFLCAPPLAGAASRLGAWPRTCPNMFASPGKNQYDSYRCHAATTAVSLRPSTCHLDRVGRVFQKYRVRFQKPQEWENPRGNPNRIKYQYYAGVWVNYTVKKNPKSRGFGVVLVDGA